jgi:serine/threonine protein kinase
MQDNDIIKITGMPGYLAPESYSRIGVTYQHSYQLDIYSLGAIIIEILTGEMGYHDVDEVRII